MSAVDYVGRYVDLVVFHGTEAVGDVPLTQALTPPGQSGAVSTGIVKLGQRFLLELLTERGSVLYRPSRGSTFLTEVRSQRIRTVTDLRAALSRGLLDVRRNLQGEDSDKYPLDEQYGGAVVDHVTLHNGYARIYISVRSRDANVKVILPINISV